MHKIVLCEFRVCGHAHDFCCYRFLHFMLYYFYDGWRMNRIWNQCQCNGSIKCANSEWEVDSSKKSKEWSCGEVECVLTVIYWKSSRRYSRIWKIRIVRAFWTPNGRLSNRFRNGDTLLNSLPHTHTHTRTHTNTPHVRWWWNTVFLFAHLNKRLNSTFYAVLPVSLMLHIRNMCDWCIYFLFVLLSFVCTRFFFFLLRFRAIRCLSAALFRLFTLVSNSNCTFQMHLVSYVYTVDWLNELWRKKRKKLSIEQTHIIIFHRTDVIQSYRTRHVSPNRSVIYFIYSSKLRKLLSFHSNSKKFRKRLLVFYQKSTARTHTHTRTHQLSHKNKCVRLFQTVRANLFKFLRVIFFRGSFFVVVCPIWDDWVVWLTDDCFRCYSDDFIIATNGNKIYNRKDFDYEEATTNRCRRRNRTSRRRRRSVIVLYTHE